MEQPEVTIIVATYQRPDALRYAVTAALRQTFTRWRMLIIGDHCGPETAAAIDAIGDPRIFYINLPARCGEQSGPNSVGMALTDTPFLTFLNHDDIWVPDFLERGLARLAESNADIFVGGSAFGWFTEERGWTFRFRTPAKRKLADVLRSSYDLFEPASSWIVRTQAAHRVGPWKPMAQIYRRSIVNWLLRAWRFGLKLEVDDDILVFKPVRINARTREYSKVDPAPFSELLAIALLPKETIAARVQADVRWATENGVSKSLLPRDVDIPIAGRFISQLADQIYRILGFDLVAVYEAFRARGDPSAWQRNVLRQRTGESLPPPYQLDDLIEYAREQLARERTLK